MAEFHHGHYAAQKGGSRIAPFARGTGAARAGTDGGTFDGELDPFDLHNAPIADIDLAPRSNGKVRYTSTFYVLRPLDLAKGNRGLFYDFGNRETLRPDRR